MTLRHALTRSGGGRGTIAASPPGRVSRIAEPLARLHALLGLPGLLIGAISIGAFGFGLVVLLREYDDLRQTSRAVLRPAIAGWARSIPVDYLRRSLADYADAWRRSPPAGRAARLADLQWALGQFGAEFERPIRRAPVLDIMEFTVRPRGASALATWRARAAPPAGGDDEADRVALLGAGPGVVAIDLDVRYRVMPEVGHAIADLEAPYHRLLLALVSLSAYPLLCLIYMGMQARALRDRAAREAAQAATIDLADRTCHELGNVAFVLANERRNLADHLELVDRFLDEEAAALASAARRAGLPPEKAGQLAEALKREYAARGVEPAVELKGGAAIAHDVLRQIAVCSDYIALTVRELDGYLKQSALPVRPEPIAVDDCVDDALALLGPRLEAASVRIERPHDRAERLVALADRRLLVHALVNLLKNAAEATSESGSSPEVRVSTRAEGPEVTLEVADNGPGIAPGDLAHIFDFGFSTKGAGRGRGLAIVRESVEAQGGRIDVASQPGAGTSFVITLPAAPGET